MVLQSFWMFLADLLAWTLQDLAVVMLVNCLAWRNTFLISNALTDKKDHQRALDVHPDLLCFPWMWRVLLFGFWAVIVNPGFVSCHDP
jgi:hypothetical protein